MKKLALVAAVGLAYLVVAGLVTAVVQHHNLL